MSHYMTALAMKQRGLKPAAKIVLYWLADHYNQSTGECFPSHKRLAELCEMTDRNVRIQLDQLSEAGLISIVKRTRDNGSQTSNSYQLKMRTDDDGGKIFPTPVENISTPPVRIFPTHNLVNNNLVNEQETPLPPKGGCSDANAISKALCAWASPDAVASFIAYRKRTKSKALTLTAAKRLANNLQEIFNAGGDTNDALGLAEERGWQSIKPEWYFNDKQRSDRGKGGQGSGMVAAFAAVAARSAAEERRRSENPDDPDDTMLWGVDLS